MARLIGIKAIWTDLIQVQINPVETSGAEQTFHDHA
jgi:hypothetical protein